MGGSDLIGAIGQGAGAIVGGITSHNASKQYAEQLNQAGQVSAAAAAQARKDILTTFDPAFSDVVTGIQGAVDQLHAGNTNTANLIKNFTSGATNALQTGAAGSRQSIEQARSQGLNQIASGFGQARGDLTAGRAGALDQINKGIGTMDPYAETGEQALQKEAALSGALGPEAQQQAIDSFIESPGQKWMREQQQQAVLSNAAATGGLGGGRVLSALQEEAFGRSATLQQQQLQNYRDLASRGQQAAGFQGQLYGQGANIHSQFGSGLANLAAQQGLASSGLMERSGQQLAGVEGQLGVNLANLRQSAGQQAVGAEQSASTNIANLLASGGQSLAGLRTSAGTNLANINLGVGSQQANLAAQLGQARAAGTMGVGSSIQQGITGMFGL